MHINPEHDEQFFLSKIDDIAVLEISLMQNHNEIEVVSQLKALVRDPNVRDIWPPAVPLATRIVNTTPYATAN